MDEKRSGSPLAVIAVVLLIPALYVGSYLALVNTDPFAEHEYKLGGDGSRIIFKPARVTHIWLGDLYHEWFGEHPKK